MSSHYFKGKALLIIEANDSEFVRYDVRAFVQSANGRTKMEPRETKHMIKEDFGLLDTESLALPQSARKLKPGDRVWVKVVYKIGYHTDDYYGETDVDIEYLKERVIRRKLCRDRARM